MGSRSPSESIHPAELNQVEFQENEEREYLLKSSSRSRQHFISLVVAASIIVFTPPTIFEKITYYYYATGNHLYGTFSGDRFWFNIIWFCVSGVVTVAILGRNTKAVVIPPLFGSLLFILWTYVWPLCTVRECYISSTDGLGSVRDFLIFGSFAVITSASCMKIWAKPGTAPTRSDIAFQLGVTTAVGFALSFFPVMHLFAGVSVGFPLNYLQWFLAGAPAGLAGSMLMLDRGTMNGAFSKLLAGLLGVVLAICLAVELPCQDCSGYPTSIVSILILSALFSVPAMLYGIKKYNSRQNSGSGIPSIARNRIPSTITIATIVITIVLLLSLIFVGSYEASVVNSFSGVSNSSFSPLEVGHSFVYSAGYLSIPRVVSDSVGINVSFANSTISQTKYPDNFLAAGVGVQSPNCCKDGLDLSYRADVIEFSNGTEAVLARAWWACDYIMPCGGYSWQQLLFMGARQLTTGKLSNWVELQMNWTASNDVQWFYRIHYVENGSVTPWVSYSVFTPPKIENHYWDAGVFGGVPPALFYQFGVSSAYPIKNGDWHILVQCPNIVLNGSRNCIPAASFISGAHSYWKVLYTFGETYQGMTFSYLGNHEVDFYYSGHSPADGSVMWTSAS